MVHEVDVEVRIFVENEIAIGRTLVVKRWSRPRKAGSTRQALSVSVPRIFFGSAKGCRSSR